MKDRLTQLILECQTYTPEYSEQARLHAEYLAQHLLNEGVIVPPCKVGQTVYVLCEDFGSIFECKIHSINYIDGVWTGRMRNAWKYSHGSMYNWTESEFGHSIFFTCEEAEKALAERSEG